MPFACLCRIPSQAIPKNYAYRIRREAAEATQKTFLYVPFLLLSSQRNFRSAFFSALGDKAVLSPVENIDLAHSRLGGNKVDILRHVPRPVDLTVVRDRLLNLYPRGSIRVRADLWKEKVTYASAQLLTRNEVPFRGRETDPLALDRSFLPEEARAR
jgi:hypothetical protein